MFLKRKLWPPSNSLKPKGYAGNSQIGSSSNFDLVEPATPLQACGVDHVQLHDGVLNNADPDPEVRVLMLVGIYLISPRRLELM